MFFLLHGGDILYNTVKKPTINVNFSHLGSTVLYGPSINPCSEIGLQLSLK